MNVKIAIYGYDTIVGKQVMEELENSNLPIEEFYPLSPFALEYDAVPLRGKNYVISYVDEFDFSKAQVALFLTTKDESERLIPEVQASGCIVIDNSHLYSNIDDQPIVLKQINPYAYHKILEKKLAVIPSAISSEIVLSTKPAHDEWGISRAIVTALVSASEHGELGTQTLARETSQLLNGLGVETTDFPAQLAFNVHTRIGQLNEKGISDYENVVQHEVFSLLDKFPEGLVLTCVQVPVFYGHTLSVHLELEEDVSLEEFKDVYANCEYLRLEEHLKPAPEYLDEDEEDDDESAESDESTDAQADESAKSAAESKSAEFKSESKAEAKADADEAKTGSVLVSPVSCAELENKVFISRIRKSSRGCFDFTVVMDNTRQGEAAAIVNILDLIRQHLA